MKTSAITAPFLIAILLGLNNGSIVAQSAGDALELFSYRATSVTKPNVYDGQIAPIANPIDWRAAYVRVMNVGINGDSLNGAQQLTFLASNDLDTLYIAAAIQLPNASDLNRFTVYFDQGTRGTLEGAPGAPGEYFVTMLADGNSPRDGHWNGSTWDTNAVFAARGFGLRKGTSGAMRLYNFELAVPLKRASDASNSYLNLNPGDKVGMLLKVTDNINNNYFWDQTNATATDPSATGSNGKRGWGEVVTSGTGIADRSLASLSANGILPTIDGNISGDNNWRYSFSKNIAFTDFRGNKLRASLNIKEQSSPGNLLFGVRLNNLTPSPTDYLALYFDQGSSGGSLNYILNNPGAPNAKLDNAARVLGNGTFQDYNFDGSNWAADASVNGSGAASVVAGNWEVEMSVPLASGDAQDLAIVSGDSVGVLLQYFDSIHNRSYWWSATVNNNKLIIDPVNPVYNALSWGFLHTGGPFVQPIYPETGDTLSGEFPLAVYTIDPNAVNPKLGIQSVTYELRKEDAAAGTFTTLLSGTLTKIVDDNLPIWTGTLNTRTINEAPGTPLTLIYFVNNGKIGPVPMPVSVFIDNSGTINLNDPTLTITSPAPGASVSGANVSITFSATTNPLLALDTVQVYVDGSLLQTYLPSGVSSYSNTYSWNTSPLTDGEHVIQVRAVNSLKLQNFSPSVVVTTNNTPSITFVSPAASSLLRGIVSVTFNATPVAPGTLASTEISIDGGAWNAVTAPPPDTGGTGSFEWNTRLVQDGTHTLRVRTTDNTGKVGYSGLRSLTVDNTPPTGTLVASPKAVKNGDTLKFVFDGNEAGITVIIPVAQLQQLDSQAPAALSLTDPANSGTYTATYTLQSANTVVDGVKSLTAMVTDAAGNTYNPQVRVQLDNTLPLFVSLVRQGPDSLYSNGQTAVLLARFDAAGYIVTCDFSALDTAYIPGSEIVTDNHDGSYSIRYTISQVNPKSNGPKIVTVTARDEVNLIASGAIALLLDNSGPAVSNLTLTDPDRVLNSNTNITATFTDEVSNIQGGEFSVDVISVAGEGNPFAPTDGAFNSLSEGVTATLSISGLAEGKHTLYVRGENAAGKWGPVASLDFVVDTKAPDIQDVEIIYPPGETSARDGQVIIVTALVTDKTTGVDPASVMLTAIDIDTAARNIRMYDDGTHGDQVAGDAIYSAAISVNSGKTSNALVYTISAQDNVPNRSTLGGTIALDNDPPHVSVAVAPLPRNGSGLNGEVYENQVILTGSYYDVPDSNAIRNIVVVVKNPSGDNVNSSPLSLPPNPERRFSITVNLVEGENDITVTVTDLSGNYAQQAITLNYIKPVETQLIGNDGGLVKSPDGTMVTIPANALLNATEISINTVATSQFPKPANPSIKLLATAHRFGPDGLVFHQPVTLTLAYSNADLDVNQDGVNDIDEANLTVFFWDGHDWIKADPETRSSTNRTVTVTTNHFSIYALGTDASPSAFGMYWTKNPFDPGEGTTAVIDVRSSGFLTLKVYDLAGNLVRTLAQREAVSGTTNRKWNGLNDFDTYVGSGIYIYILEFEDAAGTKTVIKKPIGVVK